jgi:dihydroorotate dehydrogenase
MEMREYLFLNLARTSLKVQLSSQPVMYKVVRNILFLFPTEWIHYFSMNCMKIICSIPFMKSLIKKVFDIDDPDLHLHIGKLRFKNLVGLGAGFDKNAKYLRELETLGFGFVEIGTVTPLPQKGNDKPRLFRLPKDNALVNRMGFNNDGVKTVAKRLKRWRERQSLVVSRGTIVDSRYSSLPADPPIAIRTQLIIGGNIGKNKVTPNEDAWKDYETCFKELHPYVDYFVVNVSSPNTPGLRELQEKESLRKILMHLQMINNGKAVSKPIFLKIAPDLTKEQIDDVIELSLEIKLDGLVATNTTISRDGLTIDQSQLASIGAGGLSGLPLKDKATEIVRYISTRSNGAIPIIASGGIFDGQNAKEKLDAGATLLQVWTGFIYEGPGIVKKICKAIKDEQYLA